jgi:hypothetical protein
MCDLDNTQCSRAINSISIRLMQHVELRAKDGLLYTDQRVVEQRDYDGLEANQSTNGLNRYLELSLATAKNKARSFDPNKPLKEEDRFLAEGLQPSCTGSIIKLWYTLTVFANYGTCCAEEPHCTIPLTISPPPLPNYGIVEAPPGWNPVVYNTFEFKLPGPGEVFNASAHVTSQVTANIDVGGPQAQISVPNVEVAAPNINVNMGITAPQVEVPAPQVNMNMNIPAPSVEMHVNAGIEEAKVGPNVELSIDTDKINMQVPIPEVEATIETNQNMQASAEVENVEMNVNMGGMPGMNMNVEMTAPVVTTEVTTNVSEGASVSIPPPQPAPVHAQVDLGTMPYAQVNVEGSTEATTGDASAGVAVNMGGMQMSAEVNINEDNDF